MILIEVPRETVATEAVEQLSCQLGQEERRADRTDEKCKLRRPSSAQRAIGHPFESPGDARTGGRPGQ